MIQTTTQNAKSFYPVPAVNPSALRTAQIKSIDAETNHKIYDRLLNLLSNPQIKAKKTGLICRIYLHPLTKQKLMSEHEFTPEGIDEIEGEIIGDADRMNDYEVLRDVPSALYYELEKSGNVDWIFENRIVPLPGSILNALVCETLQIEFGRKTLLSCDGFIEVRCADERGIIHKSIRLDVDGWITRRGFMLPVYKNGLIAELKIFRHPQDERPFRLKSRIRGESI